jgi:hypothetical protein
MADIVLPPECIHNIGRSWQNQANENPLPWLTENDPGNPGVRYFTLKEFFSNDDDQEITKARRQIMQSGPVPIILVV